MKKPKSPGYSYFEDDRKVMAKTYHDELKLFFEHKITEFINEAPYATNEEIAQALAIGVKDIRNFRDTDVSPLVFNL